MNRLRMVTDISFDTVSSSRYDLAIFACGYESRCTYVPRRLHGVLDVDSQILGFESSGMPSARETNEAYFHEVWGRRPILVGDQLFPHLERCLGAALLMDRPISLLVDYTSMSRLWYATILNFARFGAKAPSVTIDFVYAPGVYSETYADELCSASVKSLMPIAGMEGLSASRELSVAILGLGFTPLAGLGVLEKLQPTSVLSFYAEPGTRAEYAHVCRDRNKLLISKSSGLLPIPLGSVETAFMSLCESISPYQAEYQITIVPMGPKPHVLASMLVSARFREVSCLYAQMRRDDLSDIQASGELVVTRVVLGN